LSLFQRRLKRLRRSIYPLGLKPIEAWVKTLSGEECDVWARRLGSLAYWTLSSPRRSAHQHLQKAFGQSLSSKQTRQIAHEVFQNLVLNLFECLRLDSMDDQQFLGKIETEGWEHAEAVHRAGCGGIFVTGHIGNWELSAAYAAKRGYPVSVVARRIYLEPLNQRLVTMRERMGVKTLYRDFSMRLMIRCIQENQLLGIVPDQDVRKIGGIFVDFFGHPAYTPVGPALLALASGAPILIARDIRMGQRHLLTVDPPVYADRKVPREREVRRLVTHYTKRLEEFIREHPAQWVWTHRRWRTQPPSPSTLPEGSISSLH
jgi:KDO2-lipid IV(A) lauroyltransferase